MWDTILHILEHVATYHESLVISFFMAILAAIMTYKTIPRLNHAFINARLSGVDVLKPTRPIL